MPTRFTVTIDPPDWRNIFRKKKQAAALAAVAALRETAANAVQEGRANIAAAGPGFTRAQWLSGLQYRTKDAKEGDAPSLRATAVIFHKYGFAGVFEHGATIQGKPLLWIPTTQGGPPASKSGKKLVSATINGTPVLFDANDRDRHRKPLYIGVPSVRIPKKFRIIEIVKKHVARFAEIYSKHFKDS